MQKTLFSGTIKIAPDEPTECPLCGLTPIQALKTKQAPAVIVRPGWVRCSCRGEQEFDVQLELEKREGKEDTRGREARECFFEDANRDHKPGSESKGRTRDRACGEARSEQEWHGWPEPDKSETERLEKLVVVLKGKVPRVLRDRLVAEASKLGKNRQNRLFRWLISRHLVTLEEAFEVEYGSDTVMLEVLVTRQHADLWAAKKAALQEAEHTVSNADLMAAIMMKEWA